MALTPGTRLGSYEIVGSIGVGGMGEVYRAKDTRLPRDAAIKVSAERFNERFAGEAHAIASLNHPNITTLYDVGPDYLVMELVEGPTLAERIRQGPLPLDETIGIARQIADALDYAHERGIVHRDLKPGNVKIRPDGVVKVLDFGLAKIGVAQEASRSNESPTITTPRTEAGTIVGTVAYMSPEQIKGQAVDRRADIWAFGCVVYEMLTGTGPHSAETSQETIASILRDEPDLRKVPTHARRLIKRCLEKDPQKRLRHVGDAMALIDEPLSGEHVSAVADAAPSPQIVSTKKWGVPAVAVGIVVLAALALVAWAPWRNRTNTDQAGKASQVVSLEVGETDTMRFFYGGAMAVSPDGRWMVFPAVGQDGASRYWLRSLETVDARPLPGTETAYVPAGWSSDSRYVIFSLIGGRRLSKVDIQGGPPQTLSDNFNFTLNGLTSTKDVLLFGTSGATPLFRLPADGGKPVPVTVLAQGEISHRFPQFLPDGRRFLYLRLSTDPAKSGVYIGSIDAKPEEQDTQRLMPANRQAYYSAAPGGPGYLVFLRETTLLAQPFDPVQAVLSGEPVPIADGVDSFTPVSYGLFSVSDTGVLVYRKGAGSSLRLTWLDGNGNTVGTPGDPNVYNNATASPDGTRIAASLGPPGSRDIWIIDQQRNVTSRFTFDTGNEDLPVWSPDSKHIVFASNRGGQMQPYIKSSDGSGEERRVTEMPGIPTNWSRDGRYLLFTTPNPKTGNDIWAVPDPRIPSADSKAFAVIATSFNEQQGQFSPDGRWIAYSSDETNPVDVYVRPFSTDGSSTTAAKWLVSKGYGTAPRWRSDGKQLFYITVNTFGLMAVDVDTTKGFQALTTRRLFTAPPPLIPTGWNVSPDDKRFLFVTSPNGGRTAPFTVVLNWAAMLRK